MTTTQGSEVFAHMTGRAVEAFSMVAEANQKILRDLVDLSASTALNLGGGTFQIKGRSNASATTTGAVATWLTTSSTITLSAAVPGMN